MDVFAVGAGEVDWVMGCLRRRRERLVAHAPVFWRTAPDADARHAAYLRHLLTEDGARAWRTPASVLVAARRGAGWLVDDLHVEDGQWATDGAALWDAFAADCGGAEVRLVAPTYEVERTAHARAAGLDVAESWWLLELPSSRGGEAGVAVELPGAEAITVAAPPVYAPPGPVLFLSTTTDARRALPAALERARERGCAAVVVTQRPDDHDLADALGASGFRRHCDFFAGVVRAVDSGARGR